MRVSSIEMVLAVVVLAWVIIRQLQARRLKAWPVLGMFLVGLGVIAAVAVLSKGAWTWSAVLWLVGTALHVGVDRLDGSRLGSATIQFYFGVMLVVQTVVLNARAKSLRGSRSDDRVTAGA